MPGLWLPISAEGSLARLLRRDDALARLEGLDSPTLTSATAGDAIAYAPILMASLYQRGRAPRGVRTGLLKESRMRFDATLAGSPIWATIREQ